VELFHVATYIEDLKDQMSAPLVKLRLAAIRMLFDWLVVGQIVPTNPASAVRGPKHSIKKGKTPVFFVDETHSAIGLRDRAFIALLVYTFARVKPPWRRKSFF
jgi:site-specific recombinase XerC